LGRLGFIEIDRSYEVGRKPRCYRLQAWLLDAYLSLLEVDTGHWVDLVTGKPWVDEPIPLPSCNVPPLVQQAIGAFQSCYVNQAAILGHLRTLQKTDRENPTRSSAFRLLNDWCVYDAIRKLNPTPTPWPNVVAFHPAYQMQSTGRIGTPLQSASRAMKAAAYSGIPTL
jgi:hypothetical protein